MARIGYTPLVRCAVHADKPSPACAECRARETRDADLAGALVMFVGVGYLLAVAVGYALFKARPFIGAVAVIVALALARASEIVRERVR